MLFVVIGSSSTSAQLACDRDGDGRVDLRDYAAFARRFGPAPRPVTVWPWLEVNVQSAERVDACVAGLLVWAEVTDTAVISTRPGNAGLYAELRRRAPAMRIVPGLKTSGLLTRFDDVDGWRAVAREVDAFCAAAGERRIVLEHEGALRGLWAGEYALDLAGYAEGLRSLPSSTEYIWYPGFTGETPQARAVQSLVCRVAQQIVAARFVDLTWSSPADVRARQRDDVAARIRIARQASRLPAIPIVYCLRHETRGEIYWPLRRLFEAVHLPGEPVVIVYPGAARWVEAARELY